MSLPRTLFDKLWESHVVEDLGKDWAILHVDRHLVHDLGITAYAELQRRGLTIANPELTLGTPDHVVASFPRRDGMSSELGRTFYRQLRQVAADSRFPLLDIGSGKQGIVHVAGPESGFVLPGLSVACGDSHTCTSGAVGALAVGIGLTEVAQVMATQALRLQRPGNMRIRVEGTPSSLVGAKDVALHLIRTLGSAGARGYAVEFAGETIERMSTEGRFTFCNMAAELGARFAVIAPDDTTMAYVAGRQWTPRGSDFQAAVDHWRGLQSDPGAVFEVDVSIDCADVAPTITWGTSPDQAIPIDASIPREDEFAKAALDDARAALGYMGLQAGQSLLGLKVDWVFIGSCCNARLADLQAAARVAYGRRVASHVQAWVVPGSELVKRQAEDLGLDAVFLEAGFEWREPGCSMCAASNGDVVPPLSRCVSTSNRNFVGRQGPRSRTHLASPESAVAAAVCGHIADVRAL